MHTIWYVAVSTVYFAKEKMHIYTVEPQLGHPINTVSLLRPLICPRKTPRQYIFLLRYPVNTTTTA
jgi:hypothetical protein